MTMNANRVSTKAYRTRRSLAGAAMALFAGVVSAHAETLRGAQAVPAAASPPTAAPNAPAPSPPLAQPPAPVVLYDEAPASGFEPPVPSATRFIVVYQNDADPNATQGTVDPNRVALRIRAILRGELRSEWGVLDFEEPYDDILSAGPTRPGYQAAVDSLVATIRRAKEVAPGTKWTYYAFPRVPYWIGTDTWATLEPARRAREFDRILSSYAPVLRECDWFLPCGYDVYERALGMPVGTPEQRDAAERAYRTAGVEICRLWRGRERVESRPIVAILSPWFQPGGRATVPRAIPVPELVADQLLPVVDAGADGIALWGAMVYQLRIACGAAPADGAAARTARDDLRAVFAKDLLAGADPATVSWPSLAVRGELGRQLNATLKDALSMVDQTFRVRRKSGVGPDMPAAAPAVPATPSEPASRQNESPSPQPSPAPPKQEPQP